MMPMRDKIAAGVGCSEYAVTLVTLWLYSGGCRRGVEYAVDGKMSSCSAAARYVGICGT